jgi:hypothetical protein
VCDAGVKTRWRFCGISRVSALGRAAFTKILRHHHWAGGAKTDPTTSLARDRRNELPSLTDGSSFSVEERADLAHGLRGLLFHDPVTGAGDDAAFDIGAHIARDRGLLIAE